MHVNLKPIELNLGNDLPENYFFLDLPPQYVDC